MPLYQCENQAGFCCRLPWGYGPPRIFLFPSYTVHKEVWHTDINCDCRWVPVECPPRRRGTGPCGRVEGSCRGVVHRQTLKIQDDEVVHASPELYRQVGGRCVKPREGQKCIEPEEPPERDKCGPDITLSLANTVTRIRTVFESWGTTEKIWKCSIGPWGYLWGKGWEIHDLHASAFNSYHLDSVFCATGDCADTVAVEAKCFHSWAVNYIAFGLMSRLCSEGYWPATWLDLLTAKGIVWFYNTVMSFIDPAQYQYGDNAEKEPWVKAGFHYWPGYPTPAAPASTGSCAKCPLPPVPPRILSWHWDGYSE